MLKREAVAGAIDAAHSMFVDWGRSGEAKFSDQYEAKLEELYALCDAREIEPAAWPLVRRVDEHQRMYREWQADEQRPGGAKRPAGPGELHKKWVHGVCGEKDHPRRFPRPEPIAQKVRENCNVPQIAKTYGWWNEFGLPDTERVQRELENPGSEYDPKTWVHPHETKYWDELRAWYESRRERVRASKGDAISKGKKPAPESLDVLIRQQTNLPQILKMRPETTEEAVCRRAAELGVVLEGMTHLTQYQAHRAGAKAAEARAEADLQPYREDGPATEPAPDDKPLSSKLSSVETYAELGEDINTRVIKMAEDGHKAKAISTALTGQSPHPLSPGQVGKILAEHRRRQSGVEEAARATS